MSLNFLPNEIENIINNYKVSFETINKYNNCIKELNYKNKTRYLDVKYTNYDDIGLLCSNEKNDYFIITIFNNDNSKYFSEILIEEKDNDNDNIFSDSDSDSDSEEF
jgi:hypothetical protein